jgi:Cysteine-rich secretory protein family
MRLRAILTVVALFAGQAALAQQSDFAARVLARHNGERASVGMNPLIWDTKLAADAAKWARYLAATGTFDHAPDDPKAAPQGENLWMGTARAYSFEDMVDGWIDEKQFYRPGLFPRVSTTPNWTDVGHYTQLIWHNTTHVGCALATGRGNDVLVCRYTPAGNWDGENPTGKALATVKRKQ